MLNGACCVLLALCFTSPNEFAPLFLHCWRVALCWWPGTVKVDKLGQNSKTFLTTITTHDIEAQQRDVWNVSPDKTPGCRRNGDKCHGRRQPVTGCNAFRQRHEAAWLRVVCIVGAGSGILRYTQKSFIICLWDLLAIRPFMSTWFPCGGVCGNKFWCVCVCARACAEMQMSCPLVAEASGG